MPQNHLAFLPQVQAWRRKAHFSGAKFNPPKCLFHFYLFSYFAVCISWFVKCILLCWNRIAKLKNKSTTAQQKFCEKSCSTCMDTPIIELVWSQIVLFLSLGLITLLNILFWKFDQYRTILVSHGKSIPQDPSSRSPKFPQCTPALQINHGKFYPGLLNKVAWAP